MLISQDILTANKENLGHTKPLLKKVIHKQLYIQELGLMIK